MNDNKQKTETHKIHTKSVVVLFKALAENRGSAFHRQGATNPKTREFVSTQAAANWFVTCRWHCSFTA